MATRIRTLCAAAMFVATPALAQTGGMGSGMMNDMGRGMMHGYGQGSGMMWDHGGGCWASSIPDLSVEQRGKIADIEKEYRQKQWQLMGKMHELGGPNNGFYRGGKFDEQAARKAYDAMASLRKQMFENTLEQHKRIDSVLTPQQREQLQRFGDG